MNIDSKINHLKKEIKLNLSSMKNQNLSNKMFCNLMDDNRIKMSELTELYQEKSKEIDEKMNEFRGRNK